MILFDKRSAYERYAAGQGVSAAGTFGLYHIGTNRSFFFNAANDAQIVNMAGLAAYNVSG